MPESSCGIVSLYKGKVTEVLLEVCELLHLNCLFIDAFPPNLKVLIHVELAHCDGLDQWCSTDAIPLLF